MGVGYLKAGQWVWAEVECLCEECGFGGDHGFGG